jgi:hypothetical protein
MFCFVDSAKSSLSISTHFLSYLVVDLVSAYFKFIVSGFILTDRMGCGSALSSGSSFVLALKLETHRIDLNSNKSL